MLSLEPVYDGAGLSCSRVDLSICEPHFFIDSFADEIISLTVFCNIPLFSTLMYLCCVLL